jgi:hypothetical protein
LEVEESDACSSLGGWDSDSDPEIGPESSGASFEDEESDLSGGDSKRRRLAETIDCFPLVPAAVHRAAAAEATLIILDWDDTLLPSTWIQEQGLQIAAGSAPPNEQQEAELKKVARCVIRTLRRAKHLGQVTVVTNAEKGWVELTCSKFLPEVVPLLEGIQVLSARSAFEPTHSQPVQWKRLAFHREISAFWKRPSGYTDAGCQKNMISVGDSMHERVALLEATKDRDCWTKSLKLMERPSPEQLVKQHDLLSACIRPFVDFKGSLDLCLQVPN